MDLEAREVGRDVGHGVVRAAEALGEDELVADGIVPAAAERRHVAKEAEGAVGARELADAAEGERAEAALDVELAFAVKELAARAEFAGVGGEAVFKHEARGEAVAEVLGPLEAEAGAGVHARIHFEAVLGVLTGDVGVGVLVRKAIVNEAVELNVGGHGSACKSAENGDGSESLLHGDGPFENESEGPGASFVAPHC